MLESSQFGCCSFVMDANSRQVNNKRQQYILTFSAYWATFLRWFAHPCFGLGSGPITPLGPAMVLMDRRDLNSKPKNTYSKLTSYKKGRRAGELLVCFLRCKQADVGMQWRW